MRQRLRDLLWITLLALVMLAGLLVLGSAWVICWWWNEVTN